MAFNGRLPLKLRRVRVSGFKALNGVDVKMPGNLLFLIGANGSGKTSFLQSLAFVAYFAQGRSKQFFDDRGWTPFEIRSRVPGERSNNIIFDFLLEDESKNQIFWHFNWSLQSERAVAEFVWFRRRGHKSASRLFRQIRGTLVDSDKPQTRSFKGLLIPGSILATIEASEINTEHSNVLKNLVHWSSGLTSLELLSPAAMRKGVRGNQKDIGIRGERLTGFISGLTSEQKSRLVERLRKFYPIHTVNTVRKRAGWIDLRIREVYEQIGSTRSPHMSDGFMRLLALCSIPEFDQAVSLVLLDEVEDGIEPHVLPKLIKRIEKEAHSQLIMTSHSPLLVNFFDEEDIYFFARQEDGRTTAARVKELEIFKTASAYFGPGEIWANANLTNISREVSRASQRRDEAIVSLNPQPNLPSFFMDVE